MEVGISILSFNFSDNKNSKLVIKKINSLNSDVLCFQNVDLKTFYYIFVRMYSKYTFFKSHFDFIKENEIGNIIICSKLTISKKDISLDGVLRFEKSKQNKSVAVIKIGEVYFISMSLEDGTSSASIKMREIQMIYTHNLITQIRYCVLCGIFYNEHFLDENMIDIVISKNIDTWHFDRYTDTISKPYHRIITKHIYPLMFEYFWVGSSNYDIIMIKF